MAFVVLIFACLATLSHASTLARYDWHDDSSSGGGDVYRSLTSDPTLGKSPTLDSPALGDIRRGDAGDSYGATTTGTDDDYGPGGADDDDRDDKDGMGFSVDSLSEEKRRLLTEILSSVYDDDGLGLDVIGPSRRSDESDYGDGDDDSSSDKAEKIIADILTKGSTDPSGTAPRPSSGGLSAMDLAYRHYQKAVRVFAAAETEALEAQLALTDAKSMVATASSAAVAKASEAARGTAVQTIAAARAKARSSVLAQRQKYVSAVVDAHAKIALMKTAERRFKSLMQIFAKARAYAGVSILGVKKCASALKEAKDKRANYDDYTRAYNTAVATAKTRVGKMKVVEKRVFLMAKALAKARSEAFACKLKVRKMGYTCAKTCALASVKVRNAISDATSSVSQTIALASTAASVKAEGALDAASKSRAKSQADLQSAKLAVAEAKAQVEAVAAAQTTAATVGGTSSDDNSIPGFDDDGNSGYPTDIGSLSGAPAISNAEVAAKSSASSGAGTDATDTKAYY